MPGRLTLRRPSPTTVSFTVSNASRHTSTPAKILFYFQILLRAAIFAFVVFVNIAEFRHSFFDHDGLFVRWPAVWASPLGSYVCRIADTYTTWAVALVSAIVVYGVFRKGYTGSSGPHF